MMLPAAPRLLPQLALAGLTTLAAAVGAPARGSASGLIQALGGPAGGGAAVSAMLAQDALRREAATPSA